jgi:hypothetical protein
MCEIHVGTNIQIFFHIESGCARKVRMFQHNFVILYFQIEKIIYMIENKLK